MHSRGTAAARRSPWGSAAQPYAQGLVTSGANPKLAVFFIALLPQFVPAGAPVLPWTLAMALILICVDLVYFTRAGVGRVAGRSGPWWARGWRAGWSG